MTKRQAHALAQRKEPSAKLKSERIQGAAEKAPGATSPHGRPDLERVGPAEIAALLAEMPGWRFDPERSTFHVRIPTLVAPAEIPVGDGLIMVTGNESWYEVRLSEGAQHWTKARLEEVRILGRGLAHVVAPPAQGQPKETR